MALFRIFICRFFFVVSLVGLTNYFLYPRLLTSNFQFGEKKKKKQKKKTKEKKTKTKEKKQNTIFNEKKENLLRESKSRKVKKKKVYTYT